MKTILAAVDFSPATEAVVAAAATHARASGSRIVLLHVAPDYAALSSVAEGFSYPLDMGTPLPVDQARMTEVEKAAENRLKNIAFKLKGLEVETIVTAGTPPEEILRVSRESAAGLIVMGLPTHSPLYELIAGSATYGVLKKAPCQLLFVPAGKSASKVA